jgi:hypothetical protein
MVVDGVGTIISTILASFYLCTGVHTYLLIVVGAIFFNIDVAFGYAWWRICENTNRFIYF